MQTITAIDDIGFKLIVGYEKIRLVAYPDSGGIWTIGIGMTRYPNGARVSKGDTITQDQALAFFRQRLTEFEKWVDDMTVDTVTQNQFNALVDFAYNEGQNALKSSTLLKVVNKGGYTADAITGFFTMWDRARIDGRLEVSAGLLRRRKSEAHLFTAGELNFFEQAA